MEAVKRLRFSAVAVLVVVFALAGVARAAVEDYVPADAIAIIKVQDPVAQFDKVHNSALVQKLEDPGFIPQVADKLSSARTGIESFEAQMGVNVHDVLSDLLGREAALVALPDSQGVLIVEGRDPGSLQKGVDAALSVMRAVGALTGETTSTYKDVTVNRGLVKSGEQYYAISGNVLAAGSQLPAVQKVIDVIKGEPALGASAQYHSASGIAAKGAPITGYFTGKALQPLMDKLQAAGAGAGPAGGVAEMVRARLAAVVTAVQYGVLSISGDKALQAQLTLIYKDNRIPDAIQAFLPESGSHLDILKLAPKTAALVAARGINFQTAWDSLVKSVGANNPAGAQAMETGLDRVIGMVGGAASREEFFNQLGNQVALFVLPAGDQKGPPQAVLALQLRNTTNIPIAIGTLVGVAIMGAQQGGRGAGISLDHSEYKNAHLTTVHLGENGPVAKLLSPTFGVVGDYMVVATTLDAVHSVVDASQTGGGAPAISKPGTPVGMLTISAPQVRAILKQYGGFLAQQSAARGGNAAQPVELQVPDQVLSLLQSIQMMQTFGPGRTDQYLTITFAASQP